MLMSDDKATLHAVTYMHNNFSKQQTTDLNAQL